MTASDIKWTPPQYDSPQLPVIRERHYRTCWHRYVSDTAESHTVIANVYWNGVPERCCRAQGAVWGSRPVVTHLGT